MFFVWYTLTAGGSSTNPCSSTYRGAYAHSEIEVETQTSYMEQNVCGNMDFGLTIHSYSQLFYQPWGYDPSIEIEDQAESVCTPSIWHDKQQ